MTDPKKIPVATNRKPRANKGKPKVGRAVMAPAATVAQWFDDALRKDDPKPSLDACDKLARELQIAINQMNNAERINGAIATGNTVDVLELGLKDVSPAEILDAKVQRVIDAGRMMLSAMRELEQFTGDYHWSDDSGAISISDVRQFMRRIGVITPLAHASPHTAIGRPEERWHSAARAVTKLIRKTLEGIEYRGTLSAVDGSGAVAKIGVAAVNWAYQIDIDAEGFASAMRRRVRRQKNAAATDYASTFPDAARIKID